MTPDQFDLDDPWARFIVYALAGGKAIPISIQVEAAKVVAVGT